MLKSNQIKSKLPGGTFTTMALINCNFVAKKKGGISTRTCGSVTGAGTGIRPLALYLI
jgi:hypothetical protein